MENQIIMFVLAQLVTAAAAAGGIYAAIRADLREYKIRLDMLKEWQDKHKCH